MEPRVSSTLILDQIRVMKELYGDEPVAAARASLAPGVREEIEGLLPGGWISTEAARALKAAVAERVGEPLLALQRRVVRAAVERTLHTVWRFVMRHMSDEALAQRTPLIYARSFDRGELRFVSARPGEVQLELHGWPTIPEFDLAGLAAGVETVLAVAGRVEPRVIATRRGLVAHLHGVWKAA